MKSFNGTSFGDNMSSKLPELFKSGAIGNFKLKHEKLKIAISPEL